MTMQTPYEITGEITSADDGEDWLDDLVAAHPHVTIEQIGTATNGYPMRAVTIGTGPARAAVIATVHGNEPAAREGTFIFMRDIAEDTALLPHLAETAWTFLPTANPNGFRLNLRANAPGGQGGIDLNRDYVNQSAPESQAIAAWLTEHSPHLVLDMHEMTATAHTEDVATGKQEHALHHPAIIAMSAQVEISMSAAITGAGYTWQPYNDTPNQTRGTGRNEAGILYKATALLVETQNQQDRLNLAQRVTAHVVSLHDGMQFHLARADDLEAAHQAASGGGASGLFRTDGTPVGLFRTDGTPVTIHRTP